VLAPANRLERARAVAITDQREPEAAVRGATLLEQLHLEAIGPRQPPGGDRDAARKHGLQRPDRRQLLQHRRLELGELGGVLVRQHKKLLRAQAMLQRILRRARPAFVGLRPARLRAVPAARCGARIADGKGRARRGANTGHGGVPCRPEVGSEVVRKSRAAAPLDEPLS
jgi:hypothetical protein